MEYKHADANVATVFGAGKQARMLYKNCQGLKETDRLFRSS